VCARAPREVTTSGRFPRMPHARAALAQCARARPVSATAIRSCDAVASGSCFPPNTRERRTSAARLPPAANGALLPGELRN
jgi:hypothetical protein